MNLLRFPIVNIVCDPKNVRSFLYIFGSQWRPDDDPVRSKHVANLNNNNK